jgi:ribosomal protein S18 acetylase RimI-like enzyme
MPETAASSIVPDSRSDSGPDQSITLCDLPRHCFPAAERLWYRVYVEEMGRAQAYTDFAQRRITDPLQTSARIIGAYADGELIGTVRANYPHEAPVGYYEDLYSLKLFGADHPQRTSVITRIMVRSDFRGSNAAIRLSSHMFYRLIADNIRWIVCDCNEGVLNFFLRLGFQVHRYDAPHPDYGPVTVLKIDADDPRYRDPRHSLLARLAF